MSLTNKIYQLLVIRRHEPLPLRAVYMFSSFTNELETLKEYCSKNHMIYDLSLLRAVTRKKTLINRFCLIPALKISNDSEFLILIGSIFQVLIPKFTADL